MILLKAEVRTSSDVVQQVGCCEVVVNTWLQRYQAHGLDGLQTRQGQGRRAILQTDTDLEVVRHAVQANRQRVSLAKAELAQVRAVAQTQVRVVASQRLCGQRHAAPGRVAGTECRGQVPEHPVLRVQAKQFNLIRTTT